MEKPIKKYDGDCILYSTADGKQFLSMDEQVNEDTQTVVCVLKGELLTLVVQELMDEFNAFLAVGYHIVLDFAGVSYITSSIIQMLLFTQQKIDEEKKGSLLLRKVTADINKELVALGITELLAIE